MTEQFQLKYGTPAQIQKTPYTAGTLYLAKKDNGIGDIYLDVNGTRSLIKGEADVNAIYAIQSLGNDQYNLELEGIVGQSNSGENTLEERLTALEARVSLLENN